MDNLVSCAAIANMHKNFKTVPTDGSVNIHLPRPVAMRNIVRERQFLVQRQPVSVVRSGPAYIYTMEDGVKYTSFYPPHLIQWQPGPI